MANRWLICAQVIRRPSPKRRRCRVGSRKRKHEAMNLYSRQLATPFGEMLVAVNESDALVRLIFPNEHACWAAEIARKGYSIADDLGRCDRIVRQLDEYFEGKRRTFDLALAPQGTPFQQT